MTTIRHFLDLDSVDRDMLRRILAISVAYKRGENPLGVNTPLERTLAGKTLAMIFEKPSTRTRVSFEVGMRQLGGAAIILGHDDSQLGRGETIADTARVLSRYVDAIMLRTGEEENLLELARHAEVPVINGLTERTHPCQLMADIMTFEEKRGSIKGTSIAWVGDINNVTASWIHAAVQFEFELRIAAPRELHAAKDLLKWAKKEGGKVTLGTDPKKAVAGVDAVVTDTWVSMNHSEEEALERRTLLRPYQVNEKLMARAGKDALFMHCLPAHRGEEVTDAVIDGPHSAVWDEAENRLHVQKGILAWCLLP